MTPAELAEKLERAVTESGGIDLRNPDLIRQVAARLRSMEEALTETLEVAARHRRVALDYKYGTKADEKLPTDREWDATRDRVAAALSGDK